jgi:hypothetical protein
MVLAVQGVAPHARIICSPLHLIIHDTCGQHMTSYQELAAYTGLLHYAATALHRLLQ